MRSTPGEIEAHLASLRQTPRLIESVAEQASEAHARLRPARDAWSLVEQLAHLHACAKVWGDDIERMLALDEPVFAKPHPRQVMQSGRLLEPSFAASAAVFAGLRSRLLGTLEALEPGQWERGATINGRRHTVFTQTRRMALHETAHARQIRETWEAVAARPE